MIFEYVGVCGDVRHEPRRVQGEDIAEAADNALARLDEDHPSGEHRVVEIKEIERKGRFSVRVREDTKTARIIVSPNDFEDRWYDLEDADYLAQFAAEFKRLQDAGFQYNTNHEELAA